MTHRAVIVDNKKCNGCRICEIYCSKSHEGIIFPKASRIRIFPFFPGLDVAVVCCQCENPVCTESCPEGAIIRDESTKAIVIQEEHCTSCGICMDTCPAKAVFMHPTKNVAIKCDLCGGDPECMKHCPEGALVYGMTPFDAKASPEEISEDLRFSLLTYEK